MRLYSQEVLRLGSALGGRSKAFFAVQRWVELMDGGTPFSLSVHSLVSPLTIVNETLAMIDEYTVTASFRYGHLVASVRRSEQLLRKDRIIAKREFDDLRPQLDVIRSFMSGIDGCRQEDRKIFVDGRLILLKGALGAIKSRLDSDYVDLVLAELDRCIGSKYMDFDKLKRLDDLVSLAAVEVVRVGRSPYQASMCLVQGLRAGKSLATKDVTGLIRGMLTENQRTFQVAIVLDRVVELAESDLPPDLVFRTVAPGSEFWDQDSPPRNNEELRKFCQLHWFPEHARKKSRGNRRRATVIKIVSVSAWDIDDARIKALRQAEVLTDLINAKNRTRCIGVKRKVLVRDPKVKKVHLRQGNTGVAAELGSLKVPDAMSIARPLRFASRANDERSSVTAVLFYWISMESFFSEFPDASGRVQTVVPQVMARTAIRDVPSYWRQLIIVGRDRIDHFPQWSEFGLGETSGGRPELPEVATCLNRIDGGFDSLGDEVPLYVEYRLKRLRRIFSSISSLGDWVADVKRRSQWAMERAFFLRNQAVHTAVVEAEGELSLSLCCREIVDSMFEIAALRLGAGARSAAQGFIEYSGEYRSLEASWSSLQPRDLLSHELILGYSAMAARGGRRIR